MDALIVEVDANGRVRFDGEDWSSPSLQERRAIIYSAKSEIEELTELIEILQDDGISGSQD